MNRARTPIIAGGLFAVIAVIAIVLTAGSKGDGGHHRGATYGDRYGLRVKDDPLGVVDQVAVDRGAAAAYPEIRIRVDPDEIHIIATDLPDGAVTREVARDPRDPDGTWSRFDDQLVELHVLAGDDARVTVSSGDGAPYGDVGTAMEHVTTHGFTHLAVGSP